MPGDKPSPGRARGAWGKSSVYEILRNPKYTGYQVFNRRSSRSGRGKVNDPAKWVWSPEPTHEPLIAKWMFDQFRARAEARRGSRDDAATLNPHPQTRRSYLLRGWTHCWCGRRMNGTQRRNRRHPHGYTYYQCWPRANNRGRADRYHRQAVYIREDALLDALARFYADRIFGPYRAAALAADLDTIDDRAATDRQTERERRQRRIADLTRRQANLRRQAQELDPGDPWAQGLREDYNTLEKEKTAALALVADLDAADTVEPGRPHPDDVALLDALPYLRLNVADAPQPLLRALFEATRLTINLHEDDDVTFTVTLPADDLPTIAEAAASGWSDCPSRSQSSSRRPGGIRPGRRSRDTGGCSSSSATRRRHSATSMHGTGGPVVSRVTFRPRLPLAADKQDLLTLDSSNVNIDI